MVCLDLCPILFNSLYCIIIPRTAQSPTLHMTCILAGVLPHIKMVACFLVLHVTEINISKDMANGRENYTCNAKFNFNGIYSLS